MRFVIPAHRLLNLRVRKVNAVSARLFVSSSTVSDFCAAARAHASQKNQHDSMSTLKDTTNNSFRSLSHPVSRASSPSDSSSGEEPSVPRKPKHMDSKIADTRFTESSFSAFLNAMNAHMGTKWTVSHSYPAQRTLFEMFQEKDQDFGWAYGVLRPFWTDERFWGVEERLETAVLNDENHRQEACDGDTVFPDIEPRRIWDLYSNRVLPWAYLQLKKEDVWPVSHSWVSPEERKPILTTINQGEWPVPVPIDVDLEDVRQELIKYGAEYVWLDILCLRQAGVPENEELRKKEWAVDVPTLGYIYKDQKNIVTYISGLGRPFHMTPFDHEQNWLNRAWTLQEMNANPLIGGLASRADFSVFDPEDDDTPRRLEELVRSMIAEFDAKHQQFLARVAKAIHFVGQPFDVFDVLDRMRRRYASCELDKISGLAYPLRSDRVSYYLCDQDVEEAWIALVNSMSNEFVSQLFLLYPEPGSGKFRWLPTWDQITTAAELPRPIARTVPGRGYISQVSGRHQFSGLCIKSCRIRGLEDSNIHAGHHNRSGTLVLSVGPASPPGSPLGLMATRLREKEMEKTREKVKVRVKPHHQIPISSHEDYLLLGSNDMHHWVVCKEVEDSMRVRKLTVIRIPSSSEKKKLTMSGQVQHVERLVLD